MDLSESWSNLHQASLANNQCENSCLALWILPGMETNVKRVHSVSCWVIDFVEFRKSSPLLVASHCYENSWMWLTSWTMLKSQKDNLHGHQWPLLHFTFNIAVISHIKIYTADRLHNNPNIFRYIISSGDCCRKSIHMNSNFTNLPVTLPVTTVHRGRNRRILYVTVKNVSCVCFPLLEFLILNNVNGCKFWIHISFRCNHLMRCGGKIPNHFTNCQV